MGRRPGPLFADAALALALAVVSLVTLVGTVSTTSEAPFAGEARAEVWLSSMPSGLGAGEVWDVEITVAQHGNPLTPYRNIRPRLRIRNVRTGESTTYQAKPTGEFGVYRVRAVFPDAGVYSYAVMVDGLSERTVTIGGSAVGPSSPSTGEARQAPADSGSLTFWAVALTLVASLPVALRRRYPVVVFVVTFAAALATHFGYGSFQIAGALVALYSVAAYVGRPVSVRVAGGAAVGLALSNLGLAADTGRNGRLLFNGAVYALFAAAWLLGDNVRTRRAYLREVEERAARLERERKTNARRAAAEEQARIARELHDIIAHNVSVMTVQAAAAGDAFETQPGRVREALGSIESTGREALTELRRLLGTVRAGDEPGGFAPQPGLARLDALVEHVRAAGLAVELTVEGSPQELPPGVDLSAYRIVQEALTNTLKHARASNVSLHVRYGSRALEIEVVDDGRGGTIDGTGRGQGIIGMKERAALVGGELRVGPAPGGGFAVRAEIPLEGAEG